MSGRGRGRNNNRGRGGRKQANSDSSKSTGANSTNNPQRKSLADHVFYIGSAKQASDYIVVSQFVINHIKKTFEYGEDIGKALEDREDVDLTQLMPTLYISKSSDESLKVRENRQYEMLYEAEIQVFVQRKQIYQSNKGKAYALIWGQCNKALQNKLQA